MLNMAGTMRWIAPALLVMTVGCHGAQAARPQLRFDEIPPAVRSAFLANYQSTAICSITSETKGSQCYYTVLYVDGAAKPRTVVLNEAGDEINRY